MSSKKSDKNTSKMRLKRRLAAYKGGTNFVNLLDSNLKGIFDQIRQDKGLSYYSSLEAVVESLTEKEAQIINDKIDCFQINERLNI